MPHHPEDLRPTLSVVVPNRNDGRFLKRCLESVLAQVPPFDELIVLDDVSTDDSVAVIERAIAGYANARLVRNSANLGATENSNRGLELARGRFVLFLGANDFVLPGLVAAARPALTAYPDTGIWSAMVRTIDEEDRWSGVYPSAVISPFDRHISPREARFLLFKFGSWLTGQTTIYRREALASLGGFDTRMGGITDLFAALVVAGRHGAYFCPRPLGVLRTHRGGFLADTVRDEAVFNRVLERIRTKGPVLEPSLYTEAMLRRVEMRLQFSSLRSVAQVDFPAALERMARSPRLSLRSLAVVARFLPQGAVVGLLYLLLRPFDVLPTIWYRYIGTAWVVICERRRG